MLDVILTVLSILGSLLLVLLGIILAILLIVLFFPIGYKLQGQKNTETFRVEAQVNWLFRMIRGRFSYPEPGNVVVKALWFKLFDSKAEKNAENKDAGDKISGLKDSATDNSAKDTADGTADMGAEPSSHMSQEAEEEPSGEKKPGILSRLTEKKEKIKFKILNIYDKIKYIWENIKFYKDLLQEEQTKALLRHLFLRLKKILWSVRPRKIRADIVFGASSPDTTGYCMALYGILSPMLGRRVQFTPDFEQAVFQGEFSLAGHITLFAIVFHACVFALDKKLRLLIAKVKKFYKQGIGKRESDKQAVNDNGDNGQTAA